ncbi:MAG: hypothetical protein QOG09_1551 [Solirubrobacterales bacterium]|jgi:Zn-dependent protease|nr:hypothetical protein [Solirubrobacterales bacterium]MDX6653278.1 hypothetical protein [Solirubrobacterales bacterium]MDX6663449.1 hypothetical protein [Solirubrobacterales bacterium]
MRGSLTLFRIRGIRIAVDYSWFLILFLFIFWMSSFYRDVLGAQQADSGAYALAVASALLFFASIVLHELGHALVAIRNGIGIKGITLWMFGGIAQMDRESETPGQEFRIAAAGPLVTLAIVVVLGAISLIVDGSGQSAKALRIRSDSGVSGLMAMVGWLTSMNIFLLVFNLIPGYPLDGGRIAQSIAWRLTGDRNRATRFAATLGRGFAYVFIGIGIYLMFGRGDAGPLHAPDPVGGIWLLLIGLILSQAARAATFHTTINSKLDGIRVADVMDREPVAIPDGLSVERALDEYFLRYRWPWFPVVDASQHFRGLLERGAVDELEESRRSGSTVAEVLKPDPEGRLFVRDDEPLDALLTNETLRNLGALMAVDASGRLSGVVTIEQLSRALRGVVDGATGPA